MTNKHIVIIGAGVIGLSVAFECLRRGHRVTLLEKGVVGGQASGAAAGMLAPYSENGEGADPFFLLCHDSLRMYPDWVREVMNISDMQFEYTKSGSLNVVFHEADQLALETKKIWQGAHGVEAELIDQAQLAKLEPALSREVVSALYYPAESHLYAPDYVMALEQACRKLGAEIVEHIEQLELNLKQLELTYQVSSQTARADVQHARSIQPDEIIVCTGAWTQEWERQFGVRLPVQPIRGQICAFRPALGLQHIVYGDQGYLVEKGNGSVVCGASEDVAGFDTSTTDRGIYRLLKWSSKLSPNLQGKDPFHRWAGLRPSTPDGRPYIGRLSQAPSVIVAAGHYRNGILLSPITAKRVADLVDGKEVQDASSFSPERFGKLALID